MTTVVVSPHLDDGVLSVPGLVRRLVQEGERVLVLTAFTEGDRRHVARRSEDRAAVSMLGAEHAHLGLRDGPVRRGIAETFRSLVLSDMPPEDSDAASVAERLARELRRVAPDSVLLPLGVGEHIDHRVVHRAHSRISARSLGFYEDRPYAWVRHAVTARLARLGAVVDGEALTLASAAVPEYLASAARAAYVRAYLPEEERGACLTEVVRLPASRGDELPRLRCERLRFDESVVEVAVKAISAYRSQLGALFDDRAPADLRTDGAYEERIYWARGALGSSRAARSR